MSIEQVKVGEVAARLMERLEAEFEEDKSAQIEGVVLISAVRHDNGRRVTINYDSGSEMAPYQVMGLLQYVHALLSPDSTRAP